MRSSSELTQFEAYLIAVFGQRDYKTLIDIGCGHGNEMEFLRKNFDLETVGIDIARKHIKTARRFYPDVEFHCADFLKFRDKRIFDVAYTHGLLIHIHYRDIKSAIKKIMDLAKEGIFIESSAKDKKGKIKYNASKYWNYRAEHPSCRHDLPMQYYYSHDYAKLFRELGLGFQMVVDFKIENTKTRMWYVWRK